MKFRSCPAQRISTKVSIFDPEHDHENYGIYILMNRLFIKR